MKINSNVNTLVNQNTESRPVNREILNIARGMEAQFADLMLREMSKTVPNAEKKSSTEKYYDSLLNWERAKIMANKDKGLGLQKMIYQQLVKNER